MFFSFILIINEKACFFSQKFYIYIFSNLFSISFPPVLDLNVIESILLRHGFCISFIYKLQYIFNPKINTWGTLLVIHKHSHTGEKIETLQRQLPSQGWARRLSTFLFQLSYCKQMSLLWVISCHVSVFLSILLVISLY